MPGSWYRPALECTISAMEVAPESSKLGEIQSWTNRLPNKLINSARSLNQSVAEEAMQLTDSYEPGRGRCEGGAIKVLTFKWKSHPVPHPSFFWTV